jgi:hypothetical protein
MKRRFAWVRVVPVFFALALSRASFAASPPGPPTVVKINPPPGRVSQLTQVTLTFSEPVTNVEHVDFRIDDYPSDRVLGGGSNYTFVLTPPPYGPHRVWVQNLNDFDTPPKDLTTLRWEYELVDTDAPRVTNVFPLAGSTVRSLGQVEVFFSEPVQGLDASDLLINGQPATNLVEKPGGWCVFQFAPPAPGAVQFTWATGHGILDHAAQPNAFAPNAWNCQLDPNRAYGDVVITEILAANRYGLRDEDDAVNDWLELQNRGTQPVDLAGWSLSNDPSEPSRWVFPARMLEPGECLVVFASAKDRKTPTGSNTFHTSFTLNASGEFLGLFTPESPRGLASGFTPAYPEQRSDCSYGLDVLNQWRYFPTPTPGAPNDAAVARGLAEPVRFSVERGFFTRPFDLALSTTTPGAMIRYTTNGTEPNASTGLLYLQPIRVSASAVLRAAAFRGDLAPSRVRTHTYLFNPNAAILSLPVLSLVMDSQSLTGKNGIIGLNGGVYINGIWTPVSSNAYNNAMFSGRAWERPVSAEWIRPEDNSGFQIDCGIRLNASDYVRKRAQASDKFSYRLYFRGDYGEAHLDYPLFPTAPVTRFETIVLRGGHNDTNPFIKDELNRRLHAQMGQVAAQGTFVNLFINGVHKGYFNPCERVDEEFLESYDGAQDWDRLSVSSAVQEGDDAAWRDLHNFFLTGQNTALPAVYEAIAQRLDLVNFVDYLIVQVYGANWDWPHNNWRAARARPPEGPFRFYLWDTEACFDTGQRQPNFNVLTETNRGLANLSEISQFYQGLRVSPEFRQLFADRIQRHFFNNGAMSDTNITDQFNRMRTELAAVLPGMNLGVTTTWVPGRRAPLLAQFAAQGLYASSNAPLFSRFGGRVPQGFRLTLTAPLGGTIFYTVDGPDPRVKFSGDVHPTALAYTNGVVLAPGTPVVRARTRQGTNWSALVEAQFEVASLGVPLRISEINYNPLGGSAYEFVELQNVGEYAVDLGGMSFEGIRYLFPLGSALAPGAVLVLANNANPSLFAQRYPAVPVFGWYAGNLDNAGERLALLDATGATVTSVTFDDDNGWLTQADGLGYTLESRDAQGSPNDPANWQIGVIHGGPGLASSAPPLAVAFSEVMALNPSAVNHEGTFPDWIELHNPTSSRLDLAGWSLTDDANPRKYVFPAGASIEPGGYLVVWCDALTNTTSGLHSGFALARESGRLFLHDANTQRIDAMVYGQQIADFSLACAAGGWELAFPTPGAANAFAPTGSTTNLVINEWLANPMPGAADWLELFNRGTQPVALRGLWLGTSNALCRLGEAHFIPAGGHLQLFADEGTGSDHLDFRLPAAGGAIALYDAFANEIDRVVYAAQPEGLSRGRLPDGTATFTNFVGTASPGASNYVHTYAGPVLNEILARNQTAVTNGSGTADFVELVNPTGSPFNLGGMSLSVDEPKPGQWMFPSNTVLAPGAYLVVWCDGERPVSTQPGDFNLSRSLNGDSGGVYLFNASSQPVSVVEYGFQIPDASIGLSGGPWRLLSAPTPGLTNAPPAPLATNTALRLNEWLAHTVGAPDWFELFNATNLPVDLGGLYLTDDPSTAGQTQFRIAPLSFIGASNWVRFVADGDRDQGRHHVNFSLDARGETLRLYRTNAAAVTLLDSVAFGVQRANVSEGRWPDGSTNVAAFPGSASPGEANYLRVAGVRVNEVLTHAERAQDNAIELHNESGLPIDLSGWYWSDSQADFRKYRIPDGTVLAPGGLALFPQSEFSAAAPVGFALDWTRAGEVWLSAADGSGRLTGYRVGAAFGPAARGVSFGPHMTRFGSEFVALSALTLGDTNAPPRVGPVVINELMYHPPEGNSFSADDEYVELRNISNAAVPLFAPAHPANTWRLRGGISFDFPPGMTLPPGGLALVVPFDPAHAVALAAFRAKYAVATDAPVFGPYSGKLANEGDRVELRQPGTPASGLVPSVLVEAVTYADSLPWPGGAVDGGGLSLQRRDATQFGNDPLNWLAGPPTAGARNGPGIVAPPSIVSSPETQRVFESTPATFGVVAQGQGPLAYQWRFNGLPLPDATNDTLRFEYAVPEDSGPYDVIASNPGGSAISEPAWLSVSAIPLILVPPTNQVVLSGSNATFSVIARGGTSLRYQWRKDGADLMGRTNATLVLTNVQATDEGYYTITLTDSGYTVASSPVRLTVWVRPSFVEQPSPVTNVVLQGDSATFRVVATGTLPLSFRWRRAGATLTNITLNTNVCIYTMYNVQPGPGSNVTVVVTNIAGFAPLSSNAYLFVLLDLDRDGVADDWEQVNGFQTNSAADATLDADDDGMSNRAEYLAGTDPREPGSLLRASLSFQSGSRLSFLAVSNRTYTAQFKESIDVGSWTRFADIPAQSATRTQVVADPYPMTLGRLYRIVTPEQPDPNTGPAILQSPRGAASVTGGQARFDVVAVGEGALQYQWLFNEAALAGANQPALLLTNLTAASAGHYAVRITDARGSTLSEPARLVVRPRLVPEP